MSDKKEAPPLLIACDHAGYRLKCHLIKAFSQIEWIDLGAFDENRVDYPDYASILCERLLNMPDSKGVLVCGSGQGMSMRANKYSHIRAALVWSEVTVKLAREHNDANVICLGGRLIEPTLAEDLLKFFLITPFEGGRHTDRVKKICQPIKVK